MGFTVKDKLLSLIFPMVCVVYGVLELRLYNPMLDNVIAITAIAGGIVTGAATLIFKINTAKYLKIQTISAVITYLLWLLVGSFIQVEVLYYIYNIAVLVGSVFISTVKMPDEASVRDRLVVLFSNPVFYSLLKWLWRVISDFLNDSGAFVL